MSRSAFLFPGQGAQALGMGQALADRFPSVRRMYDEASALLSYDLAAVCWNGPKQRLDTTAVSQPALYVASLAALEALRHDEPDAVNHCVAAAGLSLGEYTALAFAEALTFADGLRVVKARGEAMQAASNAAPSGMVSVLGLEAPAVEALCDDLTAKVGLIQIANLLCPGNTVVSGAKQACDAIETAVEAKGGRTIRLAVAGAFHTPFMRPADETLAAALAGVRIHPPRVPVWSNVDAKPHTDPEEIRGLLVRQILQRVQWEQTMRGLLADGCDRFCEIGPGRVLAGLLKRVHRKAEVVNISA
ncbi:MAG TPA: ACP S-malonyltransferase [Gemmataceae bacterium]|nr:ACP S-malonyltransferase [Gemmataceae bacterium]